MKNKIIVFKLKHLYKNDPVDRLRGTNIIEALKKCGWNVEEFNNQKNIDILVYLGNDLFDKVVYKHINARYIVQDIQDNHFGNSGAKIFTNKAKKKTVFEKIIDIYKQDGFKYTFYQLLLKYIWNKTYIEYIKHVDYITTSSYSLANVVKQYNQNTFTIPDSITISTKYKTDYRSSQIELCWIGTVNNIIYLLLLNEVLRDLQKKYNISINLITSQEIYNDKSLREVMDRFQFQYVFKEWNLETVENEVLKSDIAIAPIPEGVDKSTNKILSYMSLAIPTICSGSYDYKILNESHSGSFIYVDNDYSSWYEKLEQLILSEREREKLGQSGYQLAQNYKTENIVKQYEELFSKIIERK